MTRQEFRDRLADLFDRYLAEGGDAFWLTDEIQTASMAVLGDLHCDLAEAAEQEPPY
jgi:hypothetical protein